MISASWCQWYVSRSSTFTFKFDRWYYWLWKFDGLPRLRVWTCQKSRGVTASINFDSMMHHVGSGRRSGPSDAWCMMDTMMGQCILMHWYLVLDCNMMIPDDPHPSRVLPVAVYYFESPTELRLWTANGWGRRSGMVERLGLTEDTWYFELTILYYFSMHYWWHNSDSEPAKFNCDTWHPSASLSQSASDSAVVKLVISQFRNSDSFLSAECWNLLLQQSPCSPEFGDGQKIYKTFYMILVQQ
jgi:hypothetical protein